MPNLKLSIVCLNTRLKVKTCSAVHDRNNFDCLPKLVFSHEPTCRFLHHWVAQKLPDPSMEMRNWLTVGFHRSPDLTSMTSMP